MAEQIRLVEYFHATVRDRPGEAYRMLAQLVHYRQIRFYRTAAICSQRPEKRVLVEEEEHAVAFPSSKACRIMAL